MEKFNGNMENITDKIQSEKNSVSNMQENRLDHEDSKLIKKVLEMAKEEANTMVSVYKSCYKDFAIIMNETIEERPEARKADEETLAQYDQKLKNAKRALEGPDIGLLAWYARYLKEEYTDAVECIHLAQQ